MKHFFSCKLDLPFELLVFFPFGNLIVHNQLPYVCNFPTTNCAISSTDVTHRCLLEAIKCYSPNIAASNSTSLFVETKNQVEVQTRRNLMVKLGLYSF